MWRYYGGGVIYLYKYYLLGLKVYKNKSSSEQAFLLYAGGMGFSILKYVLNELETSGLESPKIQNLCRGLDSQSKECVYRILSRQRDAYRNQQSSICASLTNEEIETQRRLHIEFLPNIYQLSQKLFYYNGYFFPADPRTEVSVHWHRHNMENFKNLQKIRQKNIIDVGGFMGDSAVIFEDFTDKKIYTFEATKSNYELLLQTLKLNNATRVVAINKGLGSQKQTLSIYVNGAGSTLCDYDSLQQTSRSEEAEIITLDSYVKENNIEVGFIKVDIEGFEQEFLKGAMETIKTQKPAMLISIYHNGADFFEIKPMIESWDLGYSFKIHKPLDFSVSTETALYCEVLD